jgi:hypothetical protein
MKRFCIAFGAMVFLGLAVAVFTQNLPPIEWVRQSGTNLTDGVGGISVDSTGVYVAGHTFGTFPGQTSAGFIDGLVRKYDANGTELWTRQFGTSFADNLLGISVDSTGVYVAGYTQGTFPGQTSAGSADAFVRKYDANGNVIWTRQFGTSSADGIFGISVDSTGIYVAGQTLGTFPGQTSAGSADAFVRKYDANGTELWTRQFGTSFEDRPYGISVDSTGVYVAGYTYGTFPGQTSAGFVDGFVRKYDANGTELWTRQFGTSSEDFLFGISVDSTGVYVAGWTVGTFPGQTSAGFIDGFVRKYDANGTELWTRQFGTSSDDRLFRISVDSTGVYVAGWTTGTFPGQTSAGDYDAFVRKYGANGTELWTCQFGTSFEDNLLGISVDSTGVYVAGHTFGTFPGQTSAGLQDIFVAKLFYSIETAIGNLIEVVQQLNLKQGIANSLDAKLQNVKESLTASNADQRNDAINKLQAFINSCEAQRGKALTNEQADMLIAAANYIITMLLQQ